jgi:hypothetical protein
VAVEEPSHHSITVKLLLTPKIASLNMNLISMADIDNQNTYNQLPEDRVQEERAQGNQVEVL